MNRKITRKITPFILFFYLVFLCQSFVGSIQANAVTPTQVIFTGDGQVHTIAPAGSPPQSTITIDDGTGNVLQVDDSQDYGSHYLQLDTAANYTTWGMQTPAGMSGNYFQSVDNVNSIMFSVHVGKTFDFNSIDLWELNAGAYVFQADNDPTKEVTINFNANEYKHINLSSNSKFKNVSVVSLREKSGSSYFTFDNIDLTIPGTTLSSDATLKSTTAIKGVTVTNFGTPAATIAGATAGSVTLTAVQGADITNIGSYITSFAPNDTNAAVTKIVKYANGASTGSFATDTAYNGTAAITNGDFFVVEVTAQDGTINYYNIEAVVQAPPAPAPTVTSLRETMGPLAAGNTTTVYGTNFTGATAVYFGSTPAVINSVNAANGWISVTVPASATVGTVHVTVVTPNGTSATSAADQYSYAPDISGSNALNPHSGPLSGGTVVTIKGTGFTGASGVDFGGVSAQSFQVDSDTQITATAPAGSAVGFVGVHVTVSSITSSDSEFNGFQYIGTVPTVTSISPATGVTGGGTTVKITGTGFTGTTVVKFGNTQLAHADFTVDSDTQITATAPAGTVGTVDITVTTPDGTSATSSADQFTYTAAPSSISVCFTGDSPQIISNALKTLRGVPSITDEDASGNVLQVDETGGKNQLMLDTAVDYGKTTPADMSGNYFSIFDGANGIKFSLQGGKAFDFNSLQLKDEWGTNNGVYAFLPNGDATKEVTFTFGSYENKNIDLSTNSDFKNVTYVTLEYQTGNGQFQCDFDNIVLNGLSASAVQSHTVTYDINGGSGTMPTDTNIYHPGDIVTTLDGSSGTASKPGYTPAAWNTKADGTGTYYFPTVNGHKTFTMGNSDVTLYLMWGKLADASLNSATLSSNSVTAGNQITITAIGDRQAAGGLIPLDQRYVPDSWTSTETGKSGTFTLNSGSYTSNYSTTAVGSYTITVTYKMQMWMPDFDTMSFDWYDFGPTNTKTITLTVNAPYVPPYIPPTPPATPTTITGDVIKENGEKVKGIPADVSTDTNGTKTVEIKSQDAVLFKQADGTNSAINDYSKLSFSAPITTGAGSNAPSVTLNLDGTIKVNNLANGSETQFNVTMDLGNGQKLVIGKMDVKVSQNGDVSLTSTLIDPYGIITDAATGKTISGANVTLYFANTPRNIANGKTPDTMVVLPQINGFKPNNNLDPQLSDANGAYGWMVFPTSDYYIVATKDGYNKYTSPTISVEQEIVKFDFSMNKTNLTKPSITLNGPADSTIKLNDTYKELGATAVDSNGVDLTKQITTTGAVDVTKPGDYTITYSVKDATGNEASVSRVIHVINTAKPVLTLNGDAEITVNQGDTFNDPGAKAIDNANKDISDKIVTNGNVNTTVLGDYTITYNVTDAYGNVAAPVTRMVHVINTTLPVITLKGSDDVTVDMNGNYQDGGATAIDNQNNDITDKIVISGAVDTTKAGDYQITYNVVDSQGNIAKSITRTVHVINRTKPVIKLNGSTVVTIKLGKAYKDAGATASDNTNADISGKLVINNKVNTAKAGDYTVTYNVTDAFGNIADSVTRTVHVVAPIVKPVNIIKSVVLAGKTDGISGSVLAAKTGGIAVAAKDFAIIKANKSVKSVFILGGTNVVDRSVEKQIKSYGVKNIIRIGGVNAYETSELIAKYMKVSKGTPVIVISSKTPSTLVKAVILNNKANAPIVLTPGNGLDKYAKVSLLNIKPAKVYAIGDSKAISTKEITDIAKLLMLKNSNIVAIKTNTDIKKIK